MSLTRPTALRCIAPTLATAFVAALGMSHTAVAQTPSVIRMPGTVRDFMQQHADFDVTPIAGPGHYAGNVDTTLGPDLRPVFTGGGYRVGLQWKNRTDQPIAPHMYRGSFPGAVLVAEATSPPTLGVLDSWDSTAGPYGGTNVGPAPTFIVGAPMPVITPPSPLPSSLGTVTYNSNITLLHDMHFDSLTIRSTVTIDGDIVIYCDDDFRMLTHAAIELAPGATLDIYFSSMSSTWNHVELNANTGDPRRVRIFNMGSDDFVLHNHSEVYAQVFSPDGALVVSNHGVLFGNYHGRHIDFQNHGDFHVDAPVVLDACGVAFNDTLGAAGVADSGAVTSAASYDQWFSDVLGTNLSMIHVMEFARDGDGVYEALISDFHPIDGRLLGNEGQSHNKLFTFEFDASFTYDACQDQFLEFYGADDCWVFIGDQLAIDLGGIVPGTSQVAELDRLNLVDGAEYSVRLFYAQRQAGGGGFNLRTNVVLQPPTHTVAGTAGFD